MAQYIVNLANGQRRELLAKSYEDALKKSIPLSRFRLVACRSNGSKYQGTLPKCDVVVQGSHYTKCYAEITPIDWSDLTVIKGQDHCYWLYSDCRDMYCPTDIHWKKVGERLFRKKVEQDGIDSRAWVPELTD